MIHRFIVLLCLCISYSVAQDNSNVKNNITNVGVFLNKISSCNFNSITGNLLCASQEFETLIQYHNVKYIKMCDYHYCIKFDGDDNTLSCSGYVLKLIGGNMDTLINPLTPNNELLDFNQDPSNIHKIGKAFLGYNVLIDSFIQNVQTKFTDNILDIECVQPHGTCIRFYGQKDLQCFGSDNFKFHDSSTSLILGIAIPSLFSFALYVMNYAFCWSKVSSNHFMIFIIIPILVISFSMLILFQEERLIVKTYIFIIGSIFGIIIGHQLARLALFLFYKLFRKKTNIDPEERKSLRSGQTRDNFEISEDEDSEDIEDIDFQRKEKDDEEVTTIELT